LFLHPAAITIDRNEASHAESLGLHFQSKRAIQDNSIISENNRNKESQKNKGGVEATNQ
jgi:hypothetical protein